jgi:magnesium transporter
MIRSFIFSTQGKLLETDIEPGRLGKTLENPAVFAWVDLEKPTAEETPSVLEETFHFHPLSIEDSINVSPSPKVEEYLPGEMDKFVPYLFMVTHAVDYSRKDQSFGTSELNFFLGKNFLVTYHDVPLRSIKATEESAQKGSMPLTRAPDRLAHTLLDAIVENYKPALEAMSVEIGEIETQALEAPDKAILNKLLRLKKEVLHLRQIMGPQLEVLSRFAHGEFKQIRPHLVPYYRDVYDSLYHISELAQNYTDSLTGILQVYLSMSSNQTSEVVKLLTLITIITTPLMMVGTWYGMNFKNMPELTWQHGYLVATSVVTVSTALTAWWFKRKNWF